MNQQHLIEFSANEIHYYMLTEVAPADSDPVQYKIQLYLTYVWMFKRVFRKSVLLMG